VFRVLLPAASEADRPEFLATHTGRVRMNRSPALKGRVLLVEDEAMVCEYVVELLSGWGLEVMPERDPFMAAGRLAGGEAFDLLLTDQTMPGMTGLALAKLTAQHRPGLPVLLYTGNASEIAQEELADCGVNALLRKPIDSAKLRPLLRELLARPGVGHGAALETGVDSVETTAAVAIENAGLP
jgi:CheY-like chemotaxis protein